MKSEWINKRNNTDLIVFFSGWGSSENINTKLNYGNFDILVFYDYRTFEQIDFDFSQYQKKYLIAWSMGVFVCNYYYEIFKNFDKLTAINGTQMPINDNYGIPSSVYDLTVNNFNEFSCAKFVKKMSTDLKPDEYATRTIKDLKDELISIRVLKVRNLLKFNKAIVSLKDRIIPSKNQLNWWQQQNTEIEQLEDKPHYIFDLYQNWSDLI